MLLSQFASNEDLLVVCRKGEEAFQVCGFASVYELALRAAEQNREIAQVLEDEGALKPIDLDHLLQTARALPPIHHPDPAHLHVTGTGLTHLGSASTRASMHAKTAEDDLTDTMKIFKMGLDGGKPASGVGVQPEWFYKGNGNTVAAPDAPLVSPGFHDDGGEEPELAGIYVVASDGTPCRIGWAQANEFSDHVMERVNYLYLAHSKLRPASFGPEILIGDLPDHVEGMSRIIRGGKTLWEKPFLSGADNMSHSFDNLEHHHFKYDVFRQPGDVHVHMFGTATLSFADGIRPEEGDVFELETPLFGRPLRNALQENTDPGITHVRQL